MKFDYSKVPMIRGYPRGDIFRGFLRSGSIPSANSLRIVSSPAFAAF